MYLLDNTKLQEDKRADEKGPLKTLSTIPCHHRSAAKETYINDQDLGDHEINMKDCQEDT